METPQSPFSILGRLADSASGLLDKFSLPAGLVQELQRRVVLLLNHVVMQEPEAQQRLVRQKGRVVLAQWRQFDMRLQITPAGLFDLADAAGTPDLLITIDQTSPLDLAKTAIQGDKPAVRIEGDVQLAAEINWMADHLRWDIEEDLARLVGDVPAHTLARVGRGVADAARSVIPEGELRDLVADGIIGGVGGVLVFLPNILLLFLGIAILEGTGYMARAAFLMDRIMRAVGLHGKSFIPLLLGFGCTVPSVLGTRTLESPRDRLVTMLVAPLMSCSAKLPVYTLLIGSFFSDEWAGTVLFIVYFIGIFLAVVMAKVFRSHLLPGDSEPFVMEMPPYHWPTAKSLVLQMWQRAGLYLRKAGTIILAASILVWFLTNRPVDVQFSQPYDELIAARQQQVLAAPEDERAALEEAVIQLQRDQQGEKLAQSYAGRIGKAVEPLVKPLGFDWKIAVSLLAAVSAKEVFVSTMATIYSVESSEESLDALRAALVADQTLTPLVAVSLMMFVLIYTPCVATLAAIRRETNSWRWPLFSAVYSVALAWVVAFLVAQIGRWLGL